MDCSLPGSSAHGIFQARVLEWVAIAFSERVPKSPLIHYHRTKDKEKVSQAGREKRPAATAKSLQSCPTLCDPRDGSPPGSPIPGILQARTLKWVVISFSSK